jgi:YD repeat-containing protein
VNLSYILNPRVTETKVGDDVNTKRTKIYYRILSGNISEYGLVNKVEAYDAYGTTVLKTQTSDYNLSSNYTSRRIIGLPSETKLYEGTDSGTLMSRITFDYDESGYSGTGQSVSATQHDAGNYGTGFNFRANLTGTNRCDAAYPTTCSNAVTSSVKYNITGSPISQTDPRGRVNTFSYTDNWSDSDSRSATYAYPTTITDSGNYSSTVKYRYDIGANVWARSPTPSGANNIYGKTSSRTYDDTTGRVLQETVDNTGAYTRYAYPNDGASLNTYTTIVDANGDTAIDGYDEVQTETLFDGAGRVRKTRTENPNSTGGYTGKLVEYDILGQVKRETVPTEINSSWNPAGDDSAWLWNTREYDWKGRVAREINTDGTDRLYSYEGCGCAGNQVTTIKGEITTATDVSGTQQTSKRRTQKIYEDILGRTVKAEVWDLDGGGSAPYSTTVNTYNGRDQVTNVREYSGSSSSTTYQDTSMTYDGHGRLSTRHNPEEFDSSSNPTHSTFTYHADDSIASVTDPRNAVTTYHYGNVDDASSEYRALPTKILYSVPGGSGIIDPADVSFTYDPAGNRTYMSDGTGNLTYSYDELSRLKTETKDFLDTLASAPNGVYELKYNYQLTGGIKSIEDPFGAIVSYDADKTGRTTAIGGSGFIDAVTETEITSYASNINYRAFGGVKSMTYSTTQATQISLDYDTRLRPTGYTADSDAVTGNIQDLTYSYHNDGSIKEAVNAVQSNYSQYYDYDFAGRLKRNEFGGSGSNKPYKQTLGYDAFSNIASRSTWTWGTERSFTAGYTNNRKTSGGFQSGTNHHDAAGNIVISSINASNDIRHWKFDAAGRMTDWEEARPYISTVMDQGALLTFDGDGRAAKRLNRTRNRANGNTTYAEIPEYDIFSSVTGQRITNLTNTGAKLRTYVYMGKTVISEQWLFGVLFKYNDPVTGGVMQGVLSGELSADGFGRVDSAALGTNIPPQNGGEEAETPDYTKGGHTGNPESRCQIDSAPVSCSLMFGLARRAGAAIGDNMVVPRWISTSGRNKSPGPGSASGVYSGQNSGTDGGPANHDSDLVIYTDTHASVDGGYWTFDFVTVDARVESNFPEKTSCEKFADEVEVIANDTLVNNNNPVTNSYPHNVNAFMDALAKRFTEVGNATDVALWKVKESGTRLITEFGSDGFADRFVDPDPNSANQARHAVFGLIMGFTGAGAAVRNLTGDTRNALQVANDREDANTKSGQADIALNNLTVLKGQEITGSGGQIAARGLAGWIRNNLCAPR